MPKIRLDVDDNGKETGSVIAALQVLQMVLERPKRNGDVGDIVNEVNLIDRMKIYENAHNILKKFIIVHGDLGNSIDHLKRELDGDDMDKWE